MLLKCKRPKAQRYRPVVSLLSTSALFAVAIVGGSVLQSGLSAVLPDEPASVADASVVVTGSHTVVSEQTEILHVAVSAPHMEISGSRLDWQTRVTGTSSWRTIDTLRLDSDGKVPVRVAPWKAAEYRAVFPGSRAVAPAASEAFRVDTRPAGVEVAHPPGAPQPHISPSTDPARRSRAIGEGANAVVSLIPDPVWARMTGVSFAENCPVGRGDLRYVQVNYWGFDGYRYRGEIVVHESIAEQAAAIFADLYRLRYPIRQMRLADDFGKDPLKGADDYASMAADNTSGFNCRYVDGKEEQRVLSPHAWGMAIDINTWENPFEARTGVFPHPYYLDRSRSHRAALQGPESPVVRAFENRGLQWGGRWSEKDYHHFETPPASRPGEKRASS
ncbi:M15 family metallopeptidase [Streptomyces sp. SKN60]|uniref:M15 family metallopeptidase n=1 Tax=Streptomyces sp. SKN60 TaxID=2855506 RepID=UPI0022486239|nr:M15 family metallopeptidase [Streptomyces sp. SKN60]MCX2185737.1 M15 family metallopeptidase [Streptomyces sp. SKN60]